MFDHHETAGHDDALGQRLRRVRLQQGLSLQDVEAGSDGELKASVVGAYERGERSISVPRLQAMAAFYNVPVVELLPRPLRDDGDRPGRPHVRLDLTRLARADVPGRVTIGRYVHNIKARRGDYNGQVLTLRAEDLDALAAALARDPEELHRDLAAHGVVRTG